MQKQEKQNDKNMLKSLFYFILIAICIYLLYLGKPWRQDRLLGPEDIKEGGSPAIRETGNSGKLSPGPSRDEKSGNKVKETGEAVNKKPKTDYNRLEKEIIKEKKSFPGIVGLIFYNLKTGDKIEINADEVFESASLVKLPVMAAVYDRADKGKIDLKNELILKEEDKTGGSGILKNEAAGSKWKVSKLIELMITRSDNTATDMIIDLAGMNNVEKTAGEMGMKKTTLRRKIFAFEEIDRGNDNYTTPRDMFVFLKEIYDGDKIREADRKKMLEILKKQTRNTMIPRYLPRDAQCAHKTGSLLGVLHDVGIIYPPDGDPYILILMGENVTDEKLGEKVFAGISKRVYFTLNPGKEKN